MFYDKAIFCDEKIQFHEKKQCSMVKKQCPVKRKQCTVINDVQCNNLMYYSRLKQLTLPQKVMQKCHNQIVKPKRFSWPILEQTFNTDLCLYEWDVCCCFHLLPWEIYIVWESYVLVASCYILVLRWIGDYFSNIFSKSWCCLQLEWMSF